MKYILAVLCVFLLISCGKQQTVTSDISPTTSDIQNSLQTPQVDTEVSGTGELSLSGNSGVQKELNIVLPQGEVSKIDINIPKGFELKKALVDSLDKITSQKNQNSFFGKLPFGLGSSTTDIAGVNQAITANPVVKTNTSSPSQSDIENVQNNGNITPTVTSQTNTVVAQTPQKTTLIGKIISLISGLTPQQTHTTVAVVSTQNTDIQTVNSQSVVTQQTQTSTTIQQQTQEQPQSNQEQNSQNPEQTSQEQNSQDVVQNSDQLGTDNLNTSAGTSSGTTNGTLDNGQSQNTSQDTSNDAQTSGETQTQVSQQVEIIDSNLPDLSKYPITSQSGSVYVFEDTQRQMGIVIALHNRGSYGTAAELIDPTLYYLGELSRQDLDPGTISNSHDYPKFDVRAEGTFDGQERIFYLRFYDFGGILVYIGVYTTPEKFEENGDTMKNIIDTFLWNEAY